VARREFSGLPIHRCSSSEQIELAQVRIDATEWFQNTANGRSDADNAPVAVTFQTQKIVAMIGAARRGHQIYDDLVPEILSFLQAVTDEANTLIDVQNTPSAEEVWTRLEAVPWPRPGKPQNQPDT
jgi:hypothetical protein